MRNQDMVLLLSYIFLYIFIYEHFCRVRILLTRSGRAPCATATHVITEMMNDLGPVRRDAPVCACTRQRIVYTFTEEGLAVASIARDDPSTLPGDYPFPRAH